MALYDGVVTVADDDIPVIVELDEDHIRLSASGTEIGQWKTDDCLISHVADSTYSISAEDEILSFVPNQPNLFAAALNGDSGNGGAPTVSPTAPAPETETEPAMNLEPVTEVEPVVENSSVGDDGVKQAPPPKPLTMGLFYALCVVTAGLAIWSLISMIF